MSGYNDPARVAGSSFSCAGDSGSAAADTIARVARRCLQ